FAPAKKFAIRSVSELSTFSETVAGNTFTNYQFIVVVPSPDSLMKGGGYGACAIDTPGFRVVPLRLGQFDIAGFGALFQLQPYWRLAAFGSVYDGSAASGLEADLRAATTLYACQSCTTFSGGVFLVQGIHLENPETLTTFCDASS